MSAKINKPKILFYDVENSANEVYAWGGRMYDLQAIKVKKPYQLLSYAYQWDGDKKINVVTREGQKSDKQLVRSLSKLLNKADIVVTHNGIDSDHRKTRTRMVYHGLRPFKALANVDTLKAARTHFMFNGNSLGDLAVFLGVGEKMKHTGFNLWTACDEDDSAVAWRQMERYNKHDVKLLRAVYLKLRPWIVNHPNVARIINPLSGTLGQCPNCGSKDVHKRGYAFSQATVKREWACQNLECGHRFKTVVPPGEKKAIKKEYGP